MIKVSVESVECGLVVNVYANGEVWAKQYESDIYGLPELDALGLLTSTDPDALSEDYPVSDSLNLSALEAAGFTRRAELQRCRPSQRVKSEGKP